MAASSKKDESESKGAAATSAATAPPVRVDNHSARSDKDAYEGHAVRVLTGDHEGAKGVFQSVATYADDGYPEEIVVHFTDPAYHAELAVLAYADVVPANYAEPDDEAAQHAEEEADARVIENDAPVEQTGEPKAEQSKASESKAEQSKS